jgi:hypothetical protein
VVTAPSPIPSWPSATADILPHEVGMPRWRRPSLRESRLRSERDAPAARMPLQFREPPDAGVERHLVAYSLVRLSSEPDELLGEELGWLDRGDEVDVLQTRGAHWLVRTPDGAVGWIHRTTVEATPMDPEASRDEPVDDAVDDEPMDDFFRFSTGGLGTPNGEPRVH